MHTTYPPSCRRPARGLLLTGPALGFLLFTAFALAQDDAPPAMPAEGEAFELNPFAVTGDRDGGYTASNSIAGTRTRTQIRDIPLNIQVYTEELADDLLLTSQVDMERYNASLINGGDDVHSNNVVQQAYNAFLFRGFVQNWGLRDGVRQYDPVDAQGMSRLEIVKGPAAALYGVSYAGGVLNVITKSVIPGESFVDLSASIDSEGEYRGTIDANITSDVAVGEVGIRYNGAYTETRDHRAHSDGRINFSQVNLAWRPSNATTIELLAEVGYREHPGGLGYFSTPETDAEGNGLGNSSDVPLQVTHDDIPWDWNWATGNMRTIQADFYRAQITHSFSENLSFNAYWSYALRDQVDSDGWDAMGGGGTIANWDTQATTGWRNPNTEDEEIVMQYHYRDWTNRIHAVGATGIYRLDFDGINNTFTFGAHSWAERFISHKWTQPEDSPYLISLPVEAGLDLNLPNQPPPDYFADRAAAGAFGPEYNANAYVFGSWQMSTFNNRLKTNVAVNYTKLELEQFNNAFSEVADNVTHDSDVLPMVGAVFDVTGEVSLFGVYSTSLFPTTDKNDFDEQLPPVEGTSYEFGTKIDLFDGKVSGTISVYEITQEGGAQRDASALNRNKVQWDQMTPEERAANFPGITDRSELTDRSGNLGDLVPGSETESKGFEADLLLQPTADWQILLSYAYNDVEVTEAVNPETIGQGTVGHIENQLSFLTKYSFSDGQLDGLFLGLGGQLSDRKLEGYVDGVARYSPKSTYLEAFTGYRFTLFGYDSVLQLNARNLTEQEEYVGWRATGSPDVLATDRYEVPTKIRYTLTYRVEF